MGKKGKATTRREYEFIGGPYDGDVVTLKGPPPAIYEVPCFWDESSVGQYKLQLFKTQGSWKIEETTVYGVTLRSYVEPEAEVAYVWKGYHEHR